MAITAITVIILSLCLSTGGYLLIRWYKSRRGKQLHEDRRGVFQKLPTDEVFKEQVHPESFYFHHEIHQKPKPEDSDSGNSKGLDEDIAKIRVGKIEFSSVYDHIRKQLQITVRRIICYPVYQSLQDNTFIYVVVYLLPDRDAFYESELQQLQEENMIDEVCEFDVLFEEIERRVALFSVFVCDRFSRHIMIGEKQYLIKVTVEHKQALSSAVSQETLSCDEVESGISPFEVSKGVFLWYLLFTVLAIWLLLFKQRRMQFKPTKRRLFC